MLNYLRKTWLVEPFVPSTWSQFGRATRTNNSALFTFNNTAPTFYRLVEELCKESSGVELTLQLVSLGRLTRCQMKETATAQGKLFSLWAKYEQGQLSTEAMLKQYQQLVVASFDLSSVGQNYRVILWWHMYQNVFNFASFFVSDYQYFFRHLFHVYLQILFDMFRN